MSWKDAGVNPSIHEEHQIYLESFTKTITKKMKAMIEKVAKEQKRIVENRNKELFKKATVAIQPKDVTIQNTISNKSTEAKLKNMMFLAQTDISQIVNQHKQIENSCDFKGVYNTLDVDEFNEFSHHMSLCREHNASFVGRVKELADINQMLLSNRSGSVMLIHGDVGCGKSMVMSKVAALLPLWIQENCVVVYRCINSSGASSTSISILRYLCLQITLAYNETFVLSSNLTKQKILKDFLILLRVISVKYGLSKPLVILLDSVDSVSSFNQCLPMKCPKWIYVFASCATKSVPKISRETTLSYHIELPSENELKLYIAKQSTYGSRCLAQNQISFLQKGVNKNTSLLLVDMWMRVAYKWKSHDDVHQMTLPNSFDVAVDIVITQLIDQYGRQFISYAMLYISLCYQGISEQELEDCLSCNNSVLNEVYEYHDPPSTTIIRIPPLMWARVRYSIQSYIKYSYVYGKMMIRWKSITFSDAVVRKIVQNFSETKIHHHLARLFLTEDYIAENIHLAKRNLELSNVNRLVTPYPLTSHPKRAMLASVHHSVQTNDRAYIMEKVLCNFRFLRHCIKAFNFSTYYSSLLQISDLLNNDTEIDLLMNAILGTQNQDLKGEHALAEYFLGVCLPFEHEYCGIRKLCSDIRSFFISSKTNYLKPLTGFGKPICSPISHVIKDVFSVTTLCSSDAIVFVQSNKSDVLGFVINVEKNSIICKLTRPKGFTNQNIAMCTLNENYIFILCASKLGYYKFTTNPADITQQTVDIKRVGLLNNCISLSTDGKSIVLAGESKLAMLKQTITNEITGYDVAHVMTLSGSTETSNILYTDDQLSSVSTHTVLTQKRSTIGVVVLWEFISQKLKSKVVLPAPAKRNALYQLESDVYLCACNGDKTYIVDMEKGAIRSDIQCGTLLYIDCKTLKSIHVPKSHKKIVCWNIEMNKVDRSIELPNSITSAVCMEDGSLLVGTETGDIILTSEYETKNTNLLGHSEKVLKIITFGKNIISYGADKRIILWDLQFRNKTLNLNETFQHRLTAIKEYNVQCIDITENTLLMVHTTSSLKNNVIMWNLETSNGIEVCKDIGPVKSLKTFDDSDKSIAYVSTDNKLSLISGTSIREVFIDASDIHIHCMASPSSPGTNQLILPVTMGCGKELRLYGSSMNKDFDSPKLLHSISFNEVIENVEYLPQCKDIVLVSFSNVNRMLVKFMKEGNKQMNLPAEVKCVNGVDAEHVVYAVQTTVYFNKLFDITKETLDIATCIKRGCSQLVVSCMYVSHNSIMIGSNKGHVIKWNYIDKSTTLIGKQKMKVTLMLIIMWCLRSM